MTQPNEYGDRTTVTALVARQDLPELSARFHRLLGNDPHGRHSNRVLLPGDTSSFGLVSGATAKPAQGALADLSKRSYESFWVRGFEFWAVPVSSIGTYFGWSDPKGVRVEFRTHTGEIYAVTVTYDMLGGQREDRKFPLIDALLDAGIDSIATALTEKAAARWAWEWTARRVFWFAMSWLGVVPRERRFDTVRLVEPPPVERVVMNRPSKPRTPAKPRSGAEDRKTP